MTDITPLGERDSAEFCRQLPDRCGIVAIPASVFYDDPETGRSFVRFAFCKSLDVIDQAVERLASFNRR